MCASSEAASLLKKTCAFTFCSSSKYRKHTGRQRSPRTIYTMVRCPLETFSSQLWYRMLRTRFPWGNNQCQSDNYGHSLGNTERQARAKANKSRLTLFKKKDLNSFNHKFLPPFILTHLRVWFSAPWFPLTSPSAGPARSKDPQQASLQMCPSCRVS